MEMYNSIPPRWLHCPRKSSVIIGKFMAFKTPLDAKYDSQVPESCRHNFDMLFDILKAYNLTMGLVVDLTNTSRFYNKWELQKLGSKYTKLLCKGHSETPNQEQTTAFIKICHTFFGQRPTEIIGVHCTHGFNRTGFLICAYLVDKLDWGIDAAVKAFAEARPPGIYKQDYLNELFKRYGDPSDTPAAPPLPSWCIESDDHLDDDGNKLNSIRQNSSSKSQRRRPVENVKKNAVFMEGVEGVPQVTDANECSRVQHQVQDMCEWTGKGFPGSQPVSMDVDNIENLKNNPYKVSWKADGIRYLMLIDGDSCFMLDRDNAVFRLSGVQFPYRKDPTRNLKETLVDGEMIMDSTGEKDLPRYLIYDIIKFEGIDVGKTDFERRLLCIDKEIIGPRHHQITQGLINRDDEPFSIRKKPFWDVNLSRKLLEGRFSRELTHEVDGLIFQPSRDPYQPGRCVNVLKWKPPEVNSIDFQLKLVKENRPGYLVTTRALLFVGGQDGFMAEMQYTKELRDLDNKIIECSWDFTKNEWKFMRQRTDKSFPNAYSTAMGVLHSLSKPVTKDKLFDLVENHAFKPHQTQRPPPKT